MGEREGGERVTARAGPGFGDLGNAEVDVSQTLPLLAQRNSRPPHSQGFGIDGSGDLNMNQSWTKAPVPNNPKFQGSAESQDADSLLLLPSPKKNKIPPKQIHQ